MVYENAFWDFYVQLFFVAVVIQYVSGYISPNIKRTFKEQKLSVDVKANYFEYVRQTMQLYATDTEYIIIQLGVCKIIIGGIYMFLIYLKKKKHLY